MHGVYKISLLYQFVFCFSLLHCRFVDLLEIGCRFNVLTCCCDCRINVGFGFRDWEYTGTGGWSQSRTLADLLVLLAS